MSADYFDVIAFKKRGEKTYPVKLGTAKKRTQGEGFNVWLDAMPASTEGQFAFSIVPQQQRGQAPAGDYNSTRKAAPIDDSDSIPF